MYKKSSSEKHNRAPIHYLYPLTCIAMHFYKTLWNISEVIYWLSHIVLQYFRVNTPSSSSLLLQVSFYPWICLYFLLLKFYSNFSRWAVKILLNRNHHFWTLGFYMFLKISDSNCRSVWLWLCGIPMNGLLCIERAQEIHKGSWALSLCFQSMLKCGHIYHCLIIFHRGNAVFPIHLIFQCLRKLFSVTVQDFGFISCYR